jgi:transposase-like protein
MIGARQRVLVANTLQHAISRNAKTPRASAKQRRAGQAEVARLQRENERLRMERDILKKSIAIFAGVRT